MLVRRCAWKLGRGDAPALCPASNTEERNNDIVAAATRCFSCERPHGSCSTPVGRCPPFFFLLWFSVLTRTGPVLKSRPDSLMWLLSFGALWESVSEPRECKNSLGVDRKYFKNFKDSDLHQKIYTFLSVKRKVQKRGTQVRRF